MAGGEEKKPPVNHWEPIFFIIGAFALGAALIWQRGGFSSLKNAGGVLITPPKQISPIPTGNQQPALQPTTNNQPITQ